MRRNIGESRTFDRYSDNWFVIAILRNKNIQFEFVLKPIKCPDCGSIIGDKKTFTFNHIEVLKQEKGNRKLHLGISDCGRYIILQEYSSEEEIEKKING